MDEDNEDKLTAIKLLTETDQPIALVNKVADPSPKLSEQGSLDVPEGYSESQMNKFERLTAQWVEDVNPGEN
jgi:hypothetical protein